MWHRRPDLAVAEALAGPVWRLLVQPPAHLLGPLQQKRLVCISFRPPIEKMKKRVGAHCLNSNLLRTDLRNPTNPVCESCGNRLNGAKALGVRPTPSGSCLLGSASLLLITSRSATLKQDVVSGAAAVCGPACRSSHGRRRGALTLG